YQHGSGNSTAKRSGVEIGLATGANVEGAAGQSSQAFFYQGCLGVYKPGNLSTILFGAAWHRSNIGFVILTDIRGVGASDCTFLAHPRYSDGGVQATRESNTYFFAHW